MNYGLCVCVPAGRESPPSSLPDSALWIASSSISLATVHNCVGSNLCDKFLYIISLCVSISILVVLILWWNTNRDWDSDGIKWKAGWENYANENIGYLSCEKKDESEGRTQIHGEVIPGGSKTVFWSKNFLPFPRWISSLLWTSDLCVLSLSPPLLNRNVYSGYCMPIPPLYVVWGADNLSFYFRYLQIKRTVLDECI